MIQDIKPEVFRNEYTKKRAARPEDTVFLFRDGTVLAAVQEGLVAFPKVADVMARLKTLERPDHAGNPGARKGQEADGETFLQYLFEIDGEGFYLWLCEDPSVAAPGPEELDLRVQAAGSDQDNSAVSSAREFRFDYIPMRSMRTVGPKERSFAAETAYQLYGWYRDNRYCGRCGHVMEIGSRERNMVCPHCGNQVYPKIMPAVIVGVLNPARDAILVTRYAGRSYKGHALIAGFCEIGETGEDTVRREVMEEAGIRVKNIRYYKTQPWGFDSDLLLGYYCEVDGDDRIRMEQDELAAAAWVPRSEITDEAEDLSLTNEMIVRFRDGLEGS